METLILIALSSSIAFIAGFLVGFVSLERNPEQMKEQAKPKNQNYLSEMLNK